jgi:hypothetical protein
MITWLWGGTFDCSPVHINHYLTAVRTSWSSGGSVGIAIGYVLDDRGSELEFGRVKNSLLLIVQSGHGPAQAWEGVKLTTPTWRNVDLYIHSSVRHAVIALSEFSTRTTLHFTLPNKHVMGPYIYIYIYIYSFICICFNNYSTKHALLQSICK